MNHSDTAAVREKPHVVKPTLQLMIRNFFEHNVGRNAASLAYYLIFAMFPLMIFVSNLLGLLELNTTGVTRILQRLLPGEIVNLIESYLDYVSQTSSHVLLWFALVFSVWFPMRAIKGLMDDVRRAYHLEKHKQPLTYTLRQLGYTVVLLVAIGLTLILSMLGKQVLGFINYLIPENFIRITDYLLGIWQYVRFIPAALLMYAALGILYAAALDKKQPIRTLLPGIVASMTSWMIVSILFSFYVENFGNYSLIYGTLGAVIMLLMWLYMTALILIMGAELNAALLTVKGGIEP